MLYCKVVNIITFGNIKLHTYRSDSKAKWRKYCKTNWTNGWVKLSEVKFGFDEFEFENPRTTAHMITKIIPMISGIESVSFMMMYANNAENTELRTKSVEITPWLSEEDIEYSKVKDMNKLPKKLNIAAMISPKIHSVQS